MTLGARLTLWQTSLLVLLLIAFALVSYRTLDAGLRSELDNVLRERADHAALALQTVPNLPIVGISPGLSDGFASPGIYLQIVDAVGRITARSANLGTDALPVHPDRLADVLVGRSFYEFESVDGQNVRLYHRPVVRDGRVVGAIEVGASLRNLENTLARLRTIFVLSILAVLSVGALGSYSLTRLGLRPLARLAALATRIGNARDLSARLPPVGPPDEVGRLTLTFNDMLSRLEAAFKAQQHFLAEVAHELRTPLTSLLGNADLLARYGDDADRRAPALEAVRAEGRRTTRLLNDLLLSVQADTGWRLDLRPTLMADVLQRVVTYSRPFADEVRVALAATPTVAVFGDADRLQQVFGNLLDNALRHTPAGGAVAIRSSVVGPQNGATCTPPGPTDHHWLLITVADTGEGIPPEALPHIFDRFYRIPGNGHGSGLGLAIARWIVEQHGGRIEVESELGQGSQFRVWLPVAPSSSYQHP